MDLQANFNGLTGSIFDILAGVTAELAQELYINNHNLVSLRPDEPSVLAVGISGKANAGKSRFSNPFLPIGLELSSLSLGQTMERPVSIASTELVEIPVWRSCWCDEHQQENRVRDCLITNPFRMNNCGDTYAEAKFFTPHMKVREHSGIETLEHSGAVPKELMSLKIQIAIASQTTRDVAVTMLNYSDGLLNSWACFQESFWEKCRAEKASLDYSR